MTIDQLRRYAEVLAEHEVAGIEVGELETDDSPPAAASSRRPAEIVASALDPIVRALHSSLPGPPTALKTSNS